MTKTILITGANRGIGLELVRAYLGMGDHSIIACCRNPEDAADLTALQDTSEGKISIEQLNLLEKAFLLVGTIEEAIAKGEKLIEEAKNQ